MVIRPEGSETSSAIERAWLPFLERTASKIPAKHGEARLAWDRLNLYVMASIESPPPQAKPRLETWDQDQYFYSAKTDQVCEMLRPFEKYLRSWPGDPGDADGRKRWQSQPEYARLMDFCKQHPEALPVVEAGAAGCYYERKARDPGTTFANARFVYLRDHSPDTPFCGDTLQFAFDLDPADQWAERTHNLKYPQGTLPRGFQCNPDSDYEFSVYNCRDGKSEVFCLLSPGCRVSVIPHPPRGKLYPHAVKEARSTVVYKDGRIVYRVALPWKSLGIESPQAGLDFGFTFRFNASQGDRTEFGPRTWPRPVERPDAPSVLERRPVVYGPLDAAAVRRIHARSTDIPDDPRNFHTPLARRLRGSYNVGLDTLRYREQGKKRRTLLRGVSVSET